MKRTLAGLLFSALWICSNALAVLPPADSDKMSEGMVYIHTSRNSPQFKRYGKEIKVSREDLIPANGLSIECEEGQYLTIVFSNRTALYVPGKASICIEDFKQVRPFRSFLTDEREATRSSINLKIDFGKCYFTSLIPRPMSILRIKTPFGTLEPHSNAFVLNCQTSSMDASLIEGHAAFFGMDGKRDFIQQKQTGIVEKAQSHDMYPLKIEPLSITLSSKYSPDLSLSKMALQTVDFRFDANGKMEASRLIPKEFLIRRGKYDYRK